MDEVRFKDSTCLWDLSLHKEGTATSWYGCRANLKSTRPALTSPEQMATELRQGVASGEIGFTSGADADVVIELYAKGFVGAFDTYLQYGSISGIIYWNLGWGTKEVPTLVAALEYAEAHCRPKDEEGKEDAKVTLDFEHNEFTEAEKARMPDPWKRLAISDVVDAAGAEACGAVVLEEFAEHHHRHRNRDKHSLIPGYFAGEQDKHP